jgi:hypothetical protein
VLVAAVFGLAVAAVVNVIDRGVPEEPTGGTATSSVPDDGEAPINGDQLAVELPGELLAEGGVIWWVDESCGVAALDVGTGEVARSPAPHCRIWPSPSGNAVAAVTEDRSAALDGAGLVVLGGETLRSSQILAHTPGLLVGDVSWAPDERSLAVCVATRDGSVVDLLDRATEDRRTIAGTCYPSYLPDGRLALVHGRTRVELGSAEILDAEGAAALLPTLPGGSQRIATALGAREGRIVLTLAAAAPSRLLPYRAVVAVLDDAGTVEFRADLLENVLPSSVGLSPRGDALWYFDASTARAVIIATPGGRRQPPLQARWVTWSPTGADLATAEPDAIVLSSWPSGQELARIPAEASYVAWGA